MKALQGLITARQFLLEVTKSFSERSSSVSEDDPIKGTIDVQPKLAGKTLGDLDYLIKALRPLTEEIDKLQQSVSLS